MNSSAKPALVLQIPIRWGDQDAMGHVNNTVYFRYMEQVRVEWMEGLGYPVDAQQTTAPVIINASCTFLAPLNYPGIVEIRMYAGNPGRSSVETTYQMRLLGEDRLYAEGTAKVVWMDMASGKSVPLPEDVRRRIDAGAPAAG